MAVKISEDFVTLNPCWLANIRRVDSRYIKFQDEGPKGLMLHSVGCAQPDAMSFIKRWNSPTFDSACVHAFIDANTGVVHQTLKWNYRGWHCGGIGNNTHIGVEMCESGYIRYTGANSFVILDRARAVEDCVRTYHSAVELFAILCGRYNLDPMKDIVSHKEGHELGIASNHGDPEHYWKGLGMAYTMDGFRKDVLHYMKGETEVTKEEVELLLEKKFETICDSLTRQFNETVEGALLKIDDHITSVVNARVGKEIEHLKDIPSKKVQKSIQKLLDAGAINGGTPAEVDDSDIHLPYTDVRVLCVMQLYVEEKLKEALSNA